MLLAVQLSNISKLFCKTLQMYQRNVPVQFSSPERVRTVRVLIKHLHAFSAKHLSDPAIRSSALRKYARQIMCARAYHYIKHQVTTWPLDASFRLVLELWLSFIQPWRYVENSIIRDRYMNNNYYLYNPLIKQELCGSCLWGGMKFYRLAYSY